MTASQLTIRRLTDGRKKAQKVLEEPGATDQFTSEVAKGDCGAMMGTLADAYGIDKNEFCSYVMADSDAFLAEDADHSPEGIVNGIDAALGIPPLDNFEDAEDATPDPDIPDNDMENRPLDEFGDIDEEPIHDCVTEPVGSSWYRGHC